jgi:glycosyltransferase involved in cell wall biosynthesis
MRIAIDARELTGQPTGVGRYLWQLLIAWNEMPAAAAHEFVLCGEQPRQLPGQPDPGGSLHLHALPNLRVQYRHARRFRGTLWEQFSLPLLSSDANVLFAPGYTAPLAGHVPIVLTIHDVSFAAHPEWFAWREGLRRRLLTKVSAHRAARILTVSGFSKREIVKRLRVYPDKVEVIYSGVHQVIPSTARTRQRAAAAATFPLILYVGSIFNRRHVPELIEGFSQLARRQPGVRLTIVGDNRTMPRVDLNSLVAASGAAERIRVREYVSDTELAALYTEASAFAFLSDYEGFGFTPLEALGAGAPPVVLDTEVAREIYGPSAAYVPRPEPSLIAAALDAMLTDTSERQRILDAAPGVLARYSWRECAHRTLQVLLACAS